MAQLQPVTFPLVGTESTGDAYEWAEEDARNENLLENLTLR